MKRIAATLGAILKGRRFPFLAAALAAALFVSALGGGWQFDDWFQRSRILGYGDANPIQIFVPYSGNPLQIERQMQYGALPWWASPHLHLAFLRYTSTLSTLLDYRLWPNHPALMHLHSLAWMAAMALGAAFLYREILGATWVAGLAALLFALDGAHAVPAAYLADRNALITATLGFLSILYFARWDRCGGGGAQRWLSAAMLALSLSAGEMGLATAAYLVAYAVTLRSGRLLARLRSLWPHACVLGLWAAIYKLGNFGSYGSGYYVDPLSDPSRFVASFWRHAIYLLMGQWTPIPAELSLAFPVGSPQSHALLIFGGVVAAVLAILLVPFALASRAARFWGLGMLLSLVPISAVGSENRLLTFVGLGAMALLAELTREAFARAVSAHWQAWRRFSQAAIIVLLPLHLIVSPLLGIARVTYQDKTSDRMLRAISSVPDDPQIRQQTLILVNPPDHVYLVTAIAVVKQVMGLPTPGRVRALSNGSAMDVTRVGPRTLRIRFDSRFFPNPFSRFMRSRNDRFFAGQRIDLPGITVVVQSLDPAGDPQQVVYRFSAPLDDPSLVWMRWHGGIYVPWTPPAVGQTERLAPVHGIY